MSDAAFLARIARELDSEPVMLVRRGLAKTIGLNEAIILQQLVWLTTAQRESAPPDAREAAGWIRGGIGRWEKQFPWWSRDTIERGFSNLRSLGLLDASQPGGPGTRCLWRVDPQAYLLACSQAVDADGARSASTAACATEANHPQNAVGLAKSASGDTSSENLPQNAVGTTRKMPLVPPAKCGRSDGGIRYLEPLKNSKDSEINDGESREARDGSPHQGNLLPLTAGEDACPTSPSPAKKERIKNPRSESTPRSKYTDADLAVAELLIERTDALVLAGHECVSQRGAPALAAAIHKGWPDGAPWRELGLALAELGAEQYWCNQFLMMARWTRPAEWLRLYNEYISRHVPLPRATAPVQEGTELRPLEEEQP